MLHNKKIIIPVIIFVAIIAAISLYLYIMHPTTSPINSAKYTVESLSHPHAKMEKDIIGFLPYWRLDDTKYIHFDLLSEVIFFSLTADENGEFVKTAKAGETEPGWRWWNSSFIKDLIAETQISGTKFSLSVAMQKNETLEKFLDNKNAQTKLITNLLDEIKTRKLDGLNVDFEYAGEPEESLRNKFTDFATQLSNEFRNQSPSTKLSIDFYPFAVQKPRMVDVPILADKFDRIIVMSYDFYSTGSDVAGPVAPIGGYKEEKYYFDITSTFEDYVSAVPKEKIIMGIPYYGLDWAVEDGKAILPKVVEQEGFPAILSYGRMKKGEDFKPQECFFDEYAKQPWCYYTKDGIDHQVWFEDNKSLEIKFDFAKQKELGGIAIWTLGYDKDIPDLWDMIKAKFTLPE